MGASCVSAKCKIHTKEVIPIDDDQLKDYPMLIDIKGVKCFTSFLESYKTGNPFPLIPSKVVSATILSYFGGIGKAVDLC